MCKNNYVNQWHLWKSKIQKIPHQRSSTSISQKNNTKEIKPMYIHQIWESKAYKYLFKMNKKQMLKHPYFIYSYIMKFLTYQKVQKIKKTNLTHIEIPLWSHRNWRKMIWTSSHSSQIGRTLSKTWIHNRMTYIK